MSFKKNLGLGFVLSLSLAASNAHSAQKLELSNLDKDSIGEVLNFPANEGIKLISANKPTKAIQIERYVQTYHGIPVWGHHIIIKRNSEGTPVSLYGTKILDLSKDEALRFSSIRLAMNPKNVLNILEKKILIQPCRASKSRIHKRNDR